jgi:hypothetical protein
MINDKWKIIGNGIVLYFAQVFSFILMSINYRAIAQANYFYTAITDVLIAILTFFIFKKIIDSKTTVSMWIGYTAGSVTGSLFGIYASKLILGN